MKNKSFNFKKLLIYTFSTLLVLSIVLAVHIYIVYRPAPDEFTKAMARIDIKQPITQTDANKISAWMYRQKGIDHVLVNPQSNIIVFTFFPLKTTGNKIADGFKSTFHLKADRFIPSDADLQKSCPAMGASYAYTVYKFIAKVI